MCVHVRPEATQIAVLEGRALIEHYVSRPADDATPDRRQHLPGPGPERPARAWRRRSSTSARRRTPCSTGATSSTTPRTSRPARRSAAGRCASSRCCEPGQTILCQVTKNPIGTKGARLTQEVSLPGRFVVLIPNSDTYGISKRLPDDERKRLRPHPRRGASRPGHGLIVRTAAEGATADELRRDVAAPARPVGADRRAGQAVEGAGAALPGAGHGRAGHPGGVQQELPGRRHRRPRAATRRSGTTSPVDQPRAGRPGRALRPEPSRCRSSSASTSTSSCTRPSTARCGCRRAARSSSSAPRP